MRHSASLFVALATLALGFVGGPARNAAADEAPQKYNAAELKELVGPVALYPDVVLGSMLPASTFPKDVKAASDYLAAQGGKVESVPQDKGWDKSVQAMLQYPDVLTWMKDNPTWMEQMAFAVAVQQSEVLAAIQTFREQAKKAGNLQSNQYQTINVEDHDATEVIVIQPTNPQVVYVPTYQPTAVVQPGYTGYGWAWGFAAGATASWAYHNINWGGSSYNGASITVNNNVTNNVGNNVGNTVGPNRSTTWNSTNVSTQRPAGNVSAPSQMPAQRPNNAAGQRPTGSGVRPPTATPRPTTPQRPATQPGNLGGGAGTRPAPTGDRPGGAAAAPSRPSGGAAPSRPSAAPGATPRPAPKPPAGGFGGGGGDAAQARAQSQRGGASLSGSSGGGDFKGHSRGAGGGGGGGGGGGRSGGGGGGGGRGGGRR